jgi:hypothetical protein
MRLAELRSMNKTTVMELSQWKQLIEVFRRRKEVFGWKEDDLFVLSTVA